MFQKYLVLFFLIVFLQNSFSQNQIIENSLAKYSYEDLEKTIKDHSINDSIKTPYIEMYFEKAKKDNDTIEIANGFSYFAEYTKDHNIGLAYSDSILLYTKHLNHRIFPALGYAHKAYRYYQLGFSRKALNYYLKAYKYAVKHNNQHQINYLNEVIQTIKRNYNPSNSNKQLNKLNQLQLKPNYKTDFKKDYYHIINNLINALQEEKKIDSASIYINQGIKETLKNNDDYYFVFVFSSGINYYLTGNHDKALDSINKAESKLIINYLSLAYYFKGKIYQKTDTNKAIGYFNKVDSIFQINHATIYGLRDNYKSLMKIYRKNDNYQKQIENIDKLIIADSIINETKLYVEEKILNEYETLKYKQEKEQLILKLKEKNAVRKRNIIYLSLLVLLVAVLGLYFLRKQLVYKKRYESIIDEINTEKVNSTNQIQENDDIGITDVTIQKILSELKLFENKQVFLNNDITLNKLSKYLNTNSSYLSKVINQYKGKSFSNYLNDLRINYIVKELKANKLLRKHTITAIAEDIGYNNTESFSKAFYKKTNLYPSYYIKQLNKDDE